MSSPEQQPLAAIVAGNVVAIRKRMHLSGDALAALLPAEAGLSRSILANIEVGRRLDITVDELAALAAALQQSDPWALTRVAVPPCETCQDAPPPGFRCLTCHRPDVDG